MKQRRSTAARRQRAGVPAVSAITLRLPLLAVAVAAALCAAGAARASSITLTLEERVEAQRRIEEVYWRHRIWPAQNADPKPALTDVLPPAALRAEVETALAKERLLAAYWGVTIGAAEVQAELERMARTSKAPNRLRELFAALDDDPALVAECLVRPLLVDRAIRERYAFDPRFHGEIRAAAEAALEAHPGIRGLQELGGEYHLTDWVRSETAQEPTPADRRAGKRSLSPEAWDREVSRLGQRLGLAAAREIRARDLPFGEVGALREERDRFLVTAVLRRGGRELGVVTVSWPKTRFDEWWAAGAPLPEGDGSGDEPDTAVPPPDRPVDFAALPRDYAHRLPEVSAADCTDDTWSVMDFGGPPLGRIYHTAVWTGSEMIVWGGDYEGYTATSTGGRYDPATDSWTRTTLDGAAASRDYHTAVWTGEEMIVWGGYGVSGAVNTGGRYNPATDSWTAVTTSGAPSARYYHTAVWTGEEMIVWGGYSGSTDLNTGGHYDPDTDSWVATGTGANLPAVRREHAAVWAGEVGRMIVWGGFSGPSGSYVFPTVGGRYDPATRTWLPTGTSGDLPIGRKELTAVWTGTEMIVWGGWKGGSPSLTDTGGRYDPTSDAWAATSTVDAPYARSGHSAVWTGAEMIIWGGYPDNDNSGGRYYPGTNSWLPTDMTGAPSTREYSTAVWAEEEGVMIVWGGETYDEDLGEDVYTDTGGRYDPDTDSWTPTSVGPEVPWQRDHHTTVWTGSEMIVWGGYDGDDRWDTGGRYDPALDAWTPTATLDAPSAREYHSAVWTGTEMIVWGGAMWDPTPPVGSGGRYDPLADSWTATNLSGAPNGRENHSAVWTGSEMIVWGGNDYYLWPQHTNSGGRYDPVADSWTATSRGENVPNPRTEHTAVWADEAGVMIVWGGHQNTYGGSVEYPEVQGGGRYDPLTDSWQPTTTDEDCPSSRYMHSAVWTGDEMIVWGGLELFNYGYMNDGARYDPAADSWTATPLSGAPVGRFGHCAVWTSEEMIVWGGEMYHLDNDPQSGGRYDPLAGSWMATSKLDAPTDRISHGGVWTGFDSEMIVWAGYPYDKYGGRYCAEVVYTWYADDDSDGYGDPDDSTQSREELPGHVLVDGDCDDTNPDVNPGVVEEDPLCEDGIDNDCDGDTDAADSGCIVVCPDADSDSYHDCTVPDCDDTGLTCGDCDDDNADSYPGASEICDGYDNDCDTVVPEDEADDDSDGMIVCAGDCDDTDPLTYDGAPEQCDGVDNDCDAVIPENEADADSDGFRLCDDDCDDGEATVYPGADELCDGLDNDCDTVVPENEADADSDGFMVCEDDCDDTDETINPGVTEDDPYCEDDVDNDCDTLVDDADPSCWDICPDLDSDGYAVCGGCELDPGDQCGDCDDDNPASYPGAMEICDGLDNDCDEVVPGDETDADSDSYRLCDLDCDDSDATVHPDAEELCDGVDNDCDTVVPENEADADSDSYRICENDCDDSNATVHPEAEELCDGLDTNCIGGIPAIEADDDSDGFMVCEDDCDDHDVTSYPGAAELCDGIDNDCDTVVPETEADGDSDGVRVCAGDCDDGDATSYPGATELCDGIDNDCDEVVPADESDADSDGYRICAGDCNDGNPDVHPGAEEVCDGLDNDCDTVIPGDEADADSDGVMICEADCDDTEATVYPDAPELCDGLDNDCDELVPEDEVDEDSDGYRLCNEDCADDDPAINPGATEVCDDGIDNDCDDLTDLDDVENCGLTRTVCSYLGDAAPPAEIDEDVYSFTGTQGEEITLTLEAVEGSGRATLILMDAMSGTVDFFHVDRSDLPNTITAILPAAGEYLIAVNEQPDVVILPGSPFTGEYCMTVDNTAGGSASWTLTTTDSVESDY